MKLTTRRQSLVRIGPAKTLGDTANETACYTMAYDHIDKCAIVRCVVDLAGPNQPQQVYSLSLNDAELDQLAELVARARLAL